MSTPSPLIMQKFKHAPKEEPPRPTHQILAVMGPTDPGKKVTIGLRDAVVEIGAHDGVVKTKHLEPGQHVRPWLNGKAQGSERVVEKVTRIEDGSEFYVEFATAHPAQRYKAAYRWFDADLVVIFTMV